MKHVSKHACFLYAQYQKRKQKKVVIFINKNLKYFSNIFHFFTGFMYAKLIKLNEILKNISSFYSSES